MKSLLFGRYTDLDKYRIYNNLFELLTKNAIIDQVKDNLIKIEGEWEEGERECISFWTAKTYLKKCKVFNYYAHWNELKLNDKQICAVKCFFHGFYIGRISK